MTKPVILTGLRANGEFHLGNYLGAILPMVELQKKHASKYQLNMFVPDLHSFTTPVDHDQLYRQTMDNLKWYAAAGLDINQAGTYIYRQSFIPAHSELTWILDCFTGFGELTRMTQFKEKGHIKRSHADRLIEIMQSELEKFVGDGTTRITPEKYETILNDIRTKYMSEISVLTSDFTTAGLFNYPVLMAADILLYGAKWVPVGEDQRQHLELARDLAMRMNNRFGELFVVPEEWKKQLEFAAREGGVRVRSLRNPEKKMSKSVEDPAGTILLSDEPEEAAKKVMSATSDSVGAVHLDWGEQPGVSNLLQISALLSERPLQEIAVEWDGKTSYGELKSHVAEQVKGFLTGLQTAYDSVDEDSLRLKLEQDEAAMREVADKTLYKIQQAVGLRAT